MIGVLICGVMVRIVVNWLSVFVEELMMLGSKVFYVKLGCSFCYGEFVVEVVGYVFDSGVLLKVVKDF